MKSLLFCYAFLLVPSVAFGQIDEFHNMEVREWMRQDLEMRRQMMQNQNNAMMMRQYAQQYAARCQQLSSYATSLEKQLKALEGQKKQEKKPAAMPYTREQVEHYKFGYELLTEVGQWLNSGKKRLELQGRMNNVVFKNSKFKIVLERK